MHGQETMFTPPPPLLPPLPAPQSFSTNPPPLSLFSRPTRSPARKRSRFKKNSPTGIGIFQCSPVFLFLFTPFYFISNTGACAPTLPPQHGTSTRHSISPAVSVRGRKYDISARGSTTLVVVSGKNSPRVFFYSIATSYIQGKQFRRGLPYLPSKPSIVSKSSCQASIIPLFCHDVIRSKEK